MANRRMIQKSLSVSKDFNSVSEFAQLLYLMITPHLDDFGKVDGDPDVIKALVLPMNKRPVEDFYSAICELEKIKRIEFYEINGQKIVRQPSFEEDQTGLNKRTTSKYPDPPSYNSNNFQEVPRTSYPTEPKRTLPNLTNANRTETVADKSIKSIRAILKDKELSIPTDTDIRDRHQLAAVEAWKKLEPENKLALQTTYLNAVRRGIKAHTIYQFVSEIKQDRMIKNPGQVFNKKVDDYCKLHEDDKS